MIAIDDEITRQVKTEVQNEQLLRAQFHHAIQQLKADMPPELLADIQEGELSILQHEQIGEYAATGLKQFLAVSLYMTRFAPNHTEMHRDGNAMLRRTLDGTYKKMPDIASAFTDCVLDYLRPNARIHREIFDYVYEKDKKHNLALGPQND